MRRNACLTLVEQLATNTMQISIALQIYEYILLCANKTKDTFLTVEILTLSVKL